MSWYTEGKPRGQTPERRAYMKAWRAANKHKIRAIQTRWVANNRERANATYRRFVANNPGYSSKYNVTNCARKRGAEGSFTEKEWRAIINKQGGKCAVCGNRTRLERDHIVPLKAGGTNYAFNIQALCRSCNARKNASVGAIMSLFDKAGA